MTESITWGYVGWDGGMSQEEISELRSILLSNADGDEQAAELALRSYLRGLCDRDAIRFTK